MSNSMDRIRAAAIDGRAKNPRYIQSQLKRLHEELVKNANSIRNAIRQDTVYSPAEIDVEFCLAIDAVKAEYLAINPERCVEEEYRVANSKDSPDRREAVGVVYIVPAPQNLLFSVMAPLAAAIAAGNCVVLQLGQTLSSVNDVLRKVLIEALDIETFTIVDSRPNDAKFFESCTQVVQVHDDKLQPGPKILISPTTSRVVAVVDRTADIEQAAKALVKARFSYGGLSPYAPDLVLVNEFRIRQFSDAVLQHSTKYFGEQANGHGYINGNGQVAASRKRRNEKDSLVEQVKNDDTCDVLVSGSRASIVLARSRESPLLKRKIDEPFLVFSSISSLDDGIDYSNSSQSALLGLYIFAEPSAAKYLSQFINASVSVINHVPVNLLVGPAAPTGYATTPSKRYDQIMFSVPRPSYTKVSGTAVALDEAVTSSAGASISQARKKLLDSALAALPPTGQKPGKHVGFFEQGLFTGMVVFILPAISTIVGLSAWGAYKGVQRFKAR